MTTKKTEAIQPTTYLKKSLVKSNDLNEAIFQLTVMEYRLLLILISQIQVTNDDSTALHIFTTKHVAQMLGITNNKDFYNRIKGAVSDLHKKTVRIAHDNVDIEHTWLITSYYSNKNGNFALELNPNLKPYVLDLKGAFTKYKLTVALTLPTMPSIRLYELLKQYARIGYRTFDIDTLRVQLGLRETEYPKAYDFKLRIISPAVMQINKNTEIHVEFTEIKESRKIVGYKFTIKENKDMGLEPIKQPNSLPSNLVRELSEIGFSTKEINFLHNYRPNFLREHLDYMLEQNSKKPYNDFKKSFKYRVRTYAKERKAETPEAPVTSELLQQSITEAIEREQAPVTEIVEKSTIELTAKDQFAVEQLNDTYPYAPFPTANNNVVITPLPVIEPIEMIKPITPQELEDFEHVPTKKGSGLLTKEMYTQLTSLGLTKAQIKHVSINYSEAHIRNNLEYTFARHLKKPLDNPKNYFLSAVRKNYHEQSLSVTEGARGVLKGDVVSHLPKIESPVQPSSDWIMADEFPIIDDKNNQFEFIEKDVTNVDYSAVTPDVNFLLEYHVHLGFVESKNELKNLQDDYADKLHSALRNGLDIEVARKLEPELVDYYIGRSH